MSGLARPSQFAAGAYFKPAEHMQDIALLFEPTKVDKGVPNTYNGKTSLRDEVTTTVTVFRTSEALEKGSPSTILTGVRVVHNGLTNKLDGLVADRGAMAGVIRKAATQAGGTAFVLDDLSDSVQSLIEAYYNTRNAEIEAAMAEAPDFGDDFGDEPPF